MPRAMVFVICGDVTRRKSFAGALFRAGWQSVFSASSISEVAALMRNASNACAIVDVELADMPGLKAVDILRQLCPDLKIIFTTRENTGDLEAQIRALDVFYYYVGSADTAELAAAVKDAIGSPRADRTRHPRKVLIVDDDRDFHVAVRAILKSAGYEAVSAYSEQEGLDAARRERPDAILLDIIMRSTTGGFAFCREVRRDPQIKHTPILGISAMEEKLALAGPPRGDGDLFPVDGYLKKPAVADRLLGELERLIS